MSIPQSIADRFEIEALRGELSDAVMMRDYDRAASLFTPAAAMRWPHIDKEFVGRDEIRAGIEWGQGLWEFFVQNVHPGTIRLNGDSAVGRAYVQEFGRMRDGGSHANHAVYHDRYQRTPDGWKFAERVYEVRYLDSTPLAGSPLPALPVPGGGGAPGRAAAPPPPGGAPPGPGRAGRGGGG
ncbi:nuclear transport factor 2 family protein, partial [Streptomyces gardneri]|uniref:nuclear transport factor 2 family protein n=1 Tax=Streptomyces gardneri TaxID=66892 RepID=UPI0033E172DF